MKTEIEAKFLDINVELIRGKLKKLGAKQVAPERLMRRKILDFSDGRLHKVGGWVRVRDEGDKITLSYKQLNDRTLHGTKEVTVAVDDFDATVNFLEALGLKEKSYQETRRESWRLDESEIEVDTWPWVPPYVEIESPIEEELKDVVKALGLEWSKALHGSVEVVYQNYYSVSEADINNLKSITFTDTPKILANNRK